MANQINIGHFGTDQHAVSPSISLSSPARDALEVAMMVGDDQLRNLGIQHDGYERPFVLVPVHGEWKRYDLQYMGTVDLPDRGLKLDSYKLKLGLAEQNLSLSELQQFGVAFGLDVQGKHGSNPTTVWLQGPDDNARP